MVILVYHIETGEFGSLTSIDVKVVQVNRVCRLEQLMRIRQHFLKTPEIIIKFVLLRSNGERSELFEFLIDLLKCLNVRIIFLDIESA